MEHYSLKENEVILCRNTVITMLDGKRQKESTGKKYETELLLTNENFIFIKKIKKILKTIVETDVYNIEEVKFYRDMPHIIRNGKLIELYFSANEIFVEFENKKDSKKFLDIALRVVSGKSKLVRTVKKVETDIKETNEALDIDIIGAASTVIDAATQVAIDSLSSKIRGVGKFSKLLIDRKKDKKQTVCQLEGNIQKIQNLKNLLDSGAISQEEYDALKAEIL